MAKKTTARRIPLPHHIQLSSASNMNLSELQDRLGVLYNSDPAGTKRKAAIKSEHYSSVRFSAKQRDEEIDLAKNRHAENIEAFDRKLNEGLEKLAKDIREERHKQVEFDGLLKKLNEYEEKVGKPQHVARDFAPHVREDKVKLTMNVSFSLTSKPPIKASSFSTPDSPAKKRKTTMEHGSSKKSRPNDQDTMPTPPESCIEPISIILRDNAFIYISSWDIPISEETVGHLKNMVGEYNFFPTVRADSTGYFLVFDGTDEGDKKAKDCYNRFRSKKFRKLHMNMKLYKTGEERAN